ncbi:MAG: hypothetical protein EBR09_04165 [Proteobacteria bacterium]|nr:hypothetical protein [Pseudomonadota bacterium]
MFVRKCLKLGFLGLSLVSACRPMSGGGCNSAQSQLTDSTLVKDIEPLSPAGGFIHFGNRACTVALMLTSANSSEIFADAYTAQHCVRENDAINPKVALSIYLPTDDGKSGGYLKNLPAIDDFFHRREQFMEEVRRLRTEAATELALKATAVPQIATTFYNAVSESESDPDGTFSFCLDQATGRLNVQRSQQICWSSLDSSVRRLTLRQSDLGASKFLRLKNFLEKRKENHLKALNQIRQFAIDFEFWTKKVNTVQGANRLFNYGNLGLFLNENVCKSIPKDDRFYQACPLRPVLVGLAEKFLVETDLDGNSKNIFRKLDELGVGLKSPLITETSVQAENGTKQIRKADFRDVFRDKFADAIIARLNADHDELRKLFTVQGNKLNPFGKHYTIATNPVSKTADGPRTMFGLIRGSALFGGTGSIPALPMSASGALRIYLPQSQSKLFFNATDSGSMITFGGIIPLLVLHTVDDKPVSGGASILALPEAQSENIPSISGKSNASGTKGIPANQEAKGGVDVKEGDYMISPNATIAGCR